MASDILAALNCKDDSKGLLQAGGHMGLIIATGGLSIVAYYHCHWTVLLACLFLHGTVCAFLANASHELVHGTVFNNPYLNGFFLYCFSFIRWFPPEYYWRYHTAHHQYTLYPDEDKDPELFPYPDQPGRLKSISLREFLTTQFVNPFNLNNVIKRNIRLSRGQFNNHWEEKLFSGEKSRRKVIIWARVLLGGHTAIAIASIASGNWIIPVLISLTPCYGGWLQLLCNHTQHAGLRKETPDFRLSCRTHYLNPVLAFLYWYMNYHIEHHMYAAVPCYNLKKLHDTIRHDLPPVLTGLIPVWKEIIAIQERQKLEPDYSYSQPLPDRGNSQKKTLPTRKSSAQASQGPAGQDRLWQCSICGFIYSEHRGLPEEGIPPGTAWADIPDDWICPDCGTRKSDFEMKEIT